MFVYVVDCVTMSFCLHVDHLPDANDRDLEQFDIFSIDKGGNATVQNHNSLRFLSKKEKSN